MRRHALILLLLALAFAIAPFFAPSFRGYDPADFPLPILDPPVQPAGYAFSIWLLLYAGLILHALRGWRRHSDDPSWEAPRLPLIGSLLVGVFWLEVAQLAPVLATLMILAMAGLAIRALARVPDGVDRWRLRAPIAAYAGWVTAAAGVACGVVLTGYGVVPAAAAALLVMAVVLVVAVTVALRLSAPLYAGVVAWALVGIVVGNLGAVPVVACAAALGAIVMLGVAVLAGRRRQRLG